MSDALVRSGLPDFGAVDAIIHARHGDPFAVLGPHDCDGGCAVRTFQPGATAVEAIAAESEQVLAQLESIDPAGFWCGVMPSPDALSSAHPVARRGAGHGGRLTLSARRWARSTSILLAEGRHRDIGPRFGRAYRERRMACPARASPFGRRMRGASRWSGASTDWDGRCHPMRHHPASGIWEMFIPRIGAGTLYKYEMLGADGRVLPLKADPVAAAAQAAARDGVHRRGRPLSLDGSRLGRGPAFGVRQDQMRRSRSMRSMPDPGCRKAATAAMSGRSLPKSSCPM